MMFLLMLFLSSSAWAQNAESAGMPDWARVLLLQDFNTRIVIGGTIIMGGAAGMVGTFLLLRKRALMGDVLTHATLPGVVLAFMIGSSIADEKSMPLLLLGGGITALLGMFCVMFLRRIRGLGDDSAMAIVLGTFFGLGVVLLGIALKSPGGNQAGLEHYIFGKTASMTRSDLIWISVVSFLVLLSIMVLFKELRLLCFDASFASSIGMRVGLVDAALLFLVMISTLIGLQAVGLILVIALLVIPPAAARFWTDDLRRSVFIAAGIGALGCYFGVMASAMSPRLPAGALIVLATTGLFLISLLCGTSGGVLGRMVGFRKLRLSVGRDHLLRAMFELTGEGRMGSVSLRSVKEMRSWSVSRVQSLMHTARKAGEASLGADGNWRLTERGMVEAAAIVRNHRLWEQYLLRYAHLAVSHVDRAADRIEHVLEPELVRRLEEDLEEIGSQEIPSPHPLQDPSEKGRES